jgi:hypothetical protein
MKACTGSKGIAPLLNPGIRWRTTSNQLHAPAASSPQMNPGILGCAPEPVLTFRVRKYLQPLQRFEHRRVQTYRYYKMYSSFFQFLTTTSDAWWSLQSQKTINPYGHNAMYSLSFRVSKMPTMEDCINEHANFDSFILKNRIRNAT